MVQHFCASHPSCIRGKVWQCLSLRDAGGNEQEDRQGRPPPSAPAPALDFSQSSRPNPHNHYNQSKPNPIQIKSLPDQRGWKNSTHCAYRRKMGDVSSYICYLFIYRLVVIISVTFLSTGLL